MMKNWGPIAAIIFAATLAYVVGVRLSESAMAVVIGVVFGVAASIPMSLILLFALRRADAYREPRTSSGRQQPTIIVAPPPIPGNQVNPWGSMSGQVYLPPFEDEADGQSARRRRFRVVGDNEEV